MLHAFPLKTLTSRIMRYDCWSWNLLISGKNKYAFTVYVENRWGYSIFLTLCNQVSDIYPRNVHDTGDINESKSLGVKFNYPDADVTGLI